MTKKIFIRDKNEVVECNINIEENKINNILSFTKYSVGDEKKLVSLGKKLLSENDSIRLSKILRDISDYKPKIEYARLIKRHIIDSIILENYDFNSILLSEEEMNDIVFLRKLRNLLLSSKNNDNLDDVSYPDEFNEAVIDIFSDSFKFDNNNIGSEITDIASDEDVDILCKDTIGNLAYTKR